MKKRSLLLLLLLFCLLPLQLSANPSGWSQTRDSFRTPRELRPRVDFWISIFTRYGKQQEVVHHRDYPQAVFKILDYTKEAKYLSPTMLARLKKKKRKAAISEVKSAFKVLATGARARTALQKRIEQEMSFLPGRITKYKKVVDGGLIRYQTGIKEKYIEAIKRSGRYLHAMERIFVREFGLPVELTRLPFIESSFDYKAYSSVGAAGIWQFMPRTAKVFGLTVGRAVDERRDVIAATRGAAKYLKSAYKQLGSWPLALTSYNHGVYGVKKKIKKLGTRDIVKIVEHPTQRVLGFASNNFYPEFLAALEVYDRYKYYFPGVHPEPGLSLYEFTMPHTMTASYVTKKLRTSAGILKNYNYALSSNVWKGVYNIPKGYKLKVPTNVRSLTANLKAPQPNVMSSSSVYGGVVYRVRRGDSLSRIAKKYGTSVSRLKRLNNLRNDKVYVGQRLVVREPENVPSGSTSGSTTLYRVRRGDTLGKIGARYRMKVSELKRINNLRSSTIRVGQMLKVRSSGSSKVSVSQAPAYYRVRSGDTLSGIGRRYGVSVSHIKRVNNLRTSSIRVGQKLKIAGSSSSGGTSSQYYKVRSGDSLWRISKKTGVSVSRLKSLNGLRSSKLKVGQKLRIR